MYIFISNHSRFPGLLEKRMTRKTNSLLKHKNTSGSFWKFQLSKGKWEVLKIDHGLVLRETPKIVIKNHTHIVYIVNGLLLSL